MKELSRLIITVFLLSLPQIIIGNPVPEIGFTVSMENPSTRRFHVTMSCNGFGAEDNLFKLPNWTPGYYWIMNYSRNVLDFKASDENGESISFEKEGKNGWRIDINGKTGFKIEYDVYAVNVSVADPFLDLGRGFISPTALFLYPAGHLDNSVEVTVIPYREWSRVSTGLDKVPGKKDTFSAANYDILYDCPILCGNQEVREFEVEGIPHYIAIERAGNSDLEGFVSDLRKVVKATFELMGDVPYKHYTFIIMDQGMGGLEHSNSMAVYSRGDFYDPARSAGNKGWMNFITHEFFHLYNVKSIRPVELGPFDYDSENYTNMLWVSEGFTVYYEYLIMNRAGLIDPDEVLDFLSGNISNYENIPGHLFQSATLSSYDTWINFFNRSGNSSNSTISYYDKGCALGMLLDLAIRNSSEGSASLDDVMRFLYNEYYKKLKRGFTESEFRNVCESFAGSSLSEIFDTYVSTTAPVDYAKYLKYAGVLIDIEPDTLDGAWAGASTRLNGKVLTVSSIEWNSPAWKAGLGEADRIVMVNGSEPSETLEKIVAAGLPGETIELDVETRGISHKINIYTAHRLVIPFKMTSDPASTSIQKKLFSSWLSVPGGSTDHLTGYDFRTTIFQIGKSNETTAPDLFQINFKSTKAK